MVRGPVPPGLSLPGVPRGRGGGRAVQGSGSPRPQESGAAQPYRNMCAPRQSCGGGGALGPRPCPLARQPGRRSVRPVPRRLPPAMSSTQFQQGAFVRALGPGVKNRVSGGAPSPAASPVTPSAVAERAPRWRPGASGRPSSPEVPRVPPMLPKLWGNSEVCALAPHPPTSRSGWVQPLPSPAPSASTHLKPSAHRSEPPALGPSSASKA